MSNILKSSNYSLKILYLRIILLLGSGFSVFAQLIKAYFEEPTFLHPMRFYTLQTNFMVFMWIIFSLIWKDDKQYYKLNGFLKGAITTYISITSIVYILLLSNTHFPEGIDVYTNIFNHYVNPWLFVLDTIIADKTEYKWKWPFYWLVYPLTYLGFTQIWGKLYQSYPYFFVNLPELGLGIFLMWVFILMLIFYTFGLFYTFINRKFLKRKDKEN